MTESVWILARWTEMPSGANWEITGAFRTRVEAVDNGRPDEFVARLPVGVRSPDEPTVFPDAEWIDKRSRK